MMIYTNWSSFKKIQAQKQTLLRKQEKDFRQTDRWMQENTP